MSLLLKSILGAVLPKPATLGLVCAPNAVPARAYVPAPKKGRKKRFRPSQKNPFLEVRPQSKLYKQFMDHLAQLRENENIIPNMRTNNA